MGKGYGEEESGECIRRIRARRKSGLSNRIRERGAYIATCKKKRAKKE